MRARASAYFLLPMLLAACAPQLARTPAVAPPRPTNAPPRPATTPAGAIPAVTAPARAADLPLAVVAFTPPANAAAALAAFRKSCASLQKREDRSGLTRPGDWAAACTAAAAAPADPAMFFAGNFRAVAIDAGKGFSTGYFEPEIAGARTATPGFPVPFYRRPPDLIEADLGDFAADLKGRKLRGRIDGKALVPYFDRAAVQAGVLAGKGLELAWAADPYEAFFLEIQGSGRLRLPDGGIMRIGYDSQNGRGYVAIGKVLVDRGDLPKGGASMNSILAWLRAHPAEAPALLAANPSVVFFREIKGDGPVGAMGIAVTPRVSVAADPLFVPLGAPLLVETTLPGNRPLSALMVAQDTGGAIKGANRIDLFMGAGAEARADAGAQAAAARILVLVPVQAAERLAR
ncbi:murein transglycosylase A [Sandarakinorhabdus sp. DWP1-3-1]|uniref:murein transglycosylase A n=1 Tax=Sandarakinorhabdus sp. DWP1-3-1 TaxID=2804627 RepID=UPI003CED4F4F